MEDLVGFDSQNLGVAKSIRFVINKEMQCISNFRKSLLLLKLHLLFWFSGVVPGPRDCFLFRLPTLSRRSIYVFLLLKVLLVRILCRYLSLLFVNELLNAVAQFYPTLDTTGGASMGTGGFNQDPAPQSSSFLPLTEETLDQPSPPANEGDGRAIRDFNEELLNIEQLKRDPYLQRSFANACISKKKIIIEIKKQNISSSISNSDIRDGIEIFCETIMQSSNIRSRNQRLSQILRDLTEHGSNSHFFADIMKEITSLNSPPG